MIPFGILEPFATEPATLVATANTGQTVTFTTAFANLMSGSPEGVGSFVPAGPISSLTLTSMFGFAIAQVDMPEPMSAALVGVGLIGVAAARRRRA